MESEAMTGLKKYTSEWLAADYILALLILLFPAYNRLMPILIVFLGLSLLRERKGLKEFSSLFNFRSPFLWFVVFYSTHVMGLLYSTDLSYAYTDLGIKASFIILPVLLAWANWKMSMRQVIDLLLSGLFAACLIAYGYAVFRSIYNQEDNHWAYFTESYFSFFMHRSYFATYLALGTLLAVNRYFTSRSRLWIFLALLFSVSTVLTFSKAGIILLFMIMIPMVIILSARHYSIKVGLVLSGLTVAGVVVMFTAIPTIKVRFSKMIEGATKVQTVNNPTIESSASRAIMWSTAMGLFSENVVIGVGTGDVSNALDERNLELGNTGVAEKSLNAHNQYLNTAVQLGLAGLIPLLLIFITSFVRAVKTKLIEGILLTLILFLTLMFESFLETQAGIIPVTLLLLLFFSISRANETSHTHPILST
jgi:O-antigen ligase